MSEIAIMDRDFAPPRADAADYRRSFERRRAADSRAAQAGPRAAGPSAAGSRGRSLRLALAALLASAALATLFIVIALPLTEIKRLSFTGLSTLDAAELSLWSGLPGRSHWFSVDCAALEAALATHPRVARVAVERRFPNTVVAAVVERTPLAVVYARGSSGRIEAHCVDSGGVVFAPASAYPDSGELPVLSGLEIRGLRYGLALEGPFSALLASLEAVRDTNPALVSAISELRLVSKSGAPAELLVYPTRYRVPVRMRPVLNAGLLKSMMLVLDVVEGEGLSPAIRELDLRTDTFVYRTKEAVSG